MKINYKFILLGLYILCISYFANGVSMLYIFDLGHNIISGCTIQHDGDFSSCKTSPAPRTRPNSIIVSPNGEFMFIASEHNVVFECLRRRDGSIHDCGVTESASPFFKNPQGMAFDRHDNLYIINKDDNKIIVCKMERDVGFLEDCKVAGTGFVGALNLAISADNRYAYIALPENRIIKVCAIKSDHTFVDINHCQNVENPQYQKPNAIAANQKERIVHIVDGVMERQAITCYLSESGGVFGNCKSNTIANSGNLAATSIAMLPYYNTTTNASYAYIATKNKINICEIKDGFYNCRPTKAINYLNITSIAYTYY